MVINFEGYFDTDSAQVKRARETPSEITNIGDSWLVAFEDSNDVHEVELTHTPEGFDGVCWIVDENGERVEECPGHQYHNGPCAHLWLIRSESSIPRVIADGGTYDPPAAGHDSRTFGRPEMDR